MKPTSGTYRTSDKHDAKRKVHRAVQDANVLLTFRLVGIKSQRLEQQLSGQIKEDINSRGERLYSPEHLGKGLPIYKDDLSES